MELTGWFNKVIKWKVSGSPRGLSVNSQHNLLVTCWRQQHRLIEYTTRGHLVREILLHDDVIHPQHAIQLNSSQFLVSHGWYSDSLHRVCVVDADGRVLLSYGNKPGAATGQLNEPGHLAVDKTRGLIFVADRYNNRIVVLDCTSLKWSCDLEVSVAEPYALLYDQQHSQLLVGEGNGNASGVVVVSA